MQRQGHPLVVEVSSWEGQIGITGKVEYGTDPLVLPQRIYGHACAGLTPTDVLL
jgi:hypothetical protein